MNKFIFIISFFLLITINAFSQGTLEEDEAADTVSTTLPIEIRKGLFTSFYQNGEKLSTSLLRDVVVKSPEAVLEMQRARKNYLASVALNTLGSFLIGYPVASSLLSGSKLNWSLTGIGIGMVGVGIPLARASGRHAQNAAVIHNQRVGKNTGYKVNLQLGLAANGAGLKLTF